MSRTAVFAFVSFLTIGVLAVVPVFAHHGTGISYDNSELFTSKAVVTQFEFKNPHVRIFFDTTDEKTGKITHWSGEMAAPSIYLRDGWTKAQALAELKSGTVVTISYWLSKAQEQLPPGVGAALIVRIRNGKGERVLLDRR
jgi:hypothetical protein